MFLSAGSVLVKNKTSCFLLAIISRKVQPEKRDQLAENFASAVGFSYFVFLDYFNVNVLYF